jgi:hypothetical protein
MDHSQTTWLGEAVCTSHRHPEGALFSTPTLGYPGAAQGGAWPSRRSAGASRHRPAGVRDGTPSMPAVCLPRLSWLIRRTANRRAYQDFTSHFCSFRAVLTSARCVAWYIRFWRRQTCRCTFCHGLSCQATFRDWPCVLAPSSDSWLDLSGYRPDLSLSRAFPLAFASSGLRLSSGIRLAPPV